VGDLAELQHDIRRRYLGEDQVMIPLGFLEFVEVLPSFDRTRPYRSAILVSGSKVRLTVEDSLSDSGNVILALTLTEADLLLDKGILN
jgi:hypothetical protein